ncbi:hypothetical protein [Brucella anthropi]|uniref:hypothetical protein n=1 Tax=Brucella anthropi TaxID=529 RepID=UPI0021658A4E|nr:hypothetical protein [Brucella anthropi]UVV66511.1 hypothetical protein NW321_08430 [Brucella anthropi]
MDDDSAAYFTRRSHLREVVARAKIYHRQARGSSAHFSVASACATMLFRNPTEAEIHEMIHLVRGEIGSRVRRNY